MANGPAVCSLLMADETLLHAKQDIFPPTRKILKTIGKNSPAKSNRHQQVIPDSNTKYVGFFPSSA